MCVRCELVKCSICVVLDMLVLGKVVAIDVATCEGRSASRFSTRGAFFVSSHTACARTSERRLVNKGFGAGRR